MTKKQILNSGQSLFEVLIALAVATIIIVALVSLTSNSIRNSNFSKNKTLAARLAQEATEWLRGQRDSDITQFRAYVQTPTWCLMDLSWNQIGACSDTEQISETPFIREVDFTSLPDASGKLIIEATVRVSWSDSQGEHVVNSSTIFSDWRER